MANTKIPVSERALLARVNRKLAAEEEIVRKSRRAYSAGHVLVDQGDFVRVDVGRNCVIDAVDLEALGRELGVLAGYEVLA